MQHSPFANSSTVSNYVFLVSDYTGPLWKCSEYVDRDCKCEEVK